MKVFGESGYWALILGGSSGMGLAAARKLADDGMNICIVHRDRRARSAEIEFSFEGIRNSGVQFCSFNTNALSAEGREEIIEKFSGIAGEGRIRLLLHSIAAGNLKALVPAKDTSGENIPSSGFLREEDFLNTVSAMATGLWDWASALMEKKHFSTDARIIGLTSEGSSLAWPGYAAVSAAKAALEALSRSMAVELAPYGIRTNIIQAGVTDTPALRAIPGSERIMAQAVRKNPFGRLTRPEDVANVISLLCRDEAAWINGALIRVDGGEFIAGHL